MGTILIITGIILTIFGTLLYFKSNSTNSQKNETKIDSDKQTFEEVKQEDKTTDNMPELQDLINLAVADGVLTDNEREIIFNKAIKLGIDNKTVEKIISEQLKLKSNNPETKLIDKEKENGDIFEAYIASKFDKQYFTLTDWTGDKYVNGVYAQTTLNPDLKMKFKLRDVEQDFAIECKYRADYYQNGVNWAKEKQFENYKNFQNRSKIPVFVAIGVGGKSNSPNDLFIISLNDIEHTFLTYNFLSKYRKANLDDNFFYNHKDLKLK